jgi:DNA-binding NarL/FixJ family response regulator
MLPSHPTLRPEVGILIVSPCRFYREGLARALSGHPGIRLARAVAGLAEALAALRASAPEVVLVDNALPQRFELARAVEASGSEARLVVLAAEARSEDLLAWAQARIAGYVSRDESLSDLLGMIQEAASGRFACSHAIVCSMLERMRALTSLVTRPPDHEVVELTERERVILGLISHGHSNKLIAERLGITLPTVKNHVHSILAKLHVRRRGEAAALYLGNGAPPRPLRAGRNGAGI